MYFKTYTSLSHLYPCWWVVFQGSNALSTLTVLGQVCAWVNNYIAVYFYLCKLLLLLLLSRFSHVRLCATPETEAHQAPHPWDSPGKNTGVGCHFLLQCMKVKSESEVAQVVSDS